MSEPSATSPGTDPATSGEHKPHPKSIKLVPLPKIVFFYPTLFISAFAWIWMAFVADGLEARSAQVIGVLFLSVFAINIVVLAFDFPRTTSLTWFAVIAAVVMGAVLLFTNKPDLLPAVEDFLKAINPVANATFYGVFTLILVAIYISVFIAVRFDYWEVRPNELLHHHGVLSDLKRVGTRNLRVDKEINDLFEYALLKAGRLILHPSSERKAIVLENVMNINKKEEEITRMLSALEVKVSTDD